MEVSHYLEIFYTINPVDGQRTITNWTYDEYTNGVADGSITSTGASVTRQLSDVTNILADDYDGGDMIVEKELQELKMK